LVLLGCFSLLLLLLLLLQGLPVKVLNVLEGFLEVLAR
jgi:hypothetical protein